MTQLTGFKMIRNLLEGNSEQALMLQFQFYFAIILLSTAQKLNFSFTDFISKCDQIFVKLLLCSDLLKKSLKENSNFCAAKYMQFFKL